MTTAVPAPLSPLQTQGRVVRNLQVCSGHLRYGGQLPAEHAAWLHRLAVDLNVDAIQDRLVKERHRLDMMGPADGAF